jgi:hypothetical protein
MGGGALGVTQPGTAGDPNAGTQSLAISVPDDFYAVRVGFLCHYGSEAFEVPLIKACASTGFNDGMNPIGGGAWVRLTAAMAGADVDRVVLAPDAPAALPMPAIVRDPATGRSDIPQLVWSDWTALPSAPPDAEGWRWCFIRQVIPAGYGFSYVMGNFDGLLDGSAGNRGNGYCLRPANCALADYVTDAHTTADQPPMNPELASIYHWWAGSPIAIVQFMTVHDGITIMNVGDSHHSGLATTGDANTAVFQAASSLGRTLVGTLPVGIVNAAWPGANAQMFFGSATRLLPAVRPSIVVLPGWTFNEPDASGLLATPAANGAFSAQLLQFADLCLQHGAVPIYTTPYPRDPECMSDATRLAAWRALRQTILGMRESGSIVVDTTPVLSAADDDGSLLGTYKPGLSDDSVHPNDAGQAVVAGVLRPALEQAMLLAA